jgi:D-3-phosphoglycerate dehydrogenase / 2-oxoglutarate reductase
MKVLITTVPFGASDKTPIELLENEGIEYLINPLGKKLTEPELAEMMPGFDVLIAGTEQISEKVINQADNLKLISRVGIGLDSVNLQAARKRNIAVAYTPDAPAPAVAEFTLGLIFSLLRSTHVSNMHMHERKWHRYFGKQLAECTVGIIGAGRIGSRVAKYLEYIPCRRLLINELDDELRDNFRNAEWVDKDTIFSESDVVSVHVPLTSETKNMITITQMESMKNDSVIVNTSRGGIVNEEDLYEAVESGKIGGAAIDVFEQEPYTGKLLKLDQCLLTAHMGSMSFDCRARMEIEATEEVLRFYRNESLLNPIPEAEYKIQLESNER